MLSSRCRSSPSGRSPPAGLRPATWPDLVGGLGSPAPPADFPSRGPRQGCAAAVAVSAPYLARPLRHTGRWLVGSGAVSATAALGVVVAPGYVLGALAVGWAAAALVHLLFGSPIGTPPLPEVRRALLAMGLDAEPHGTQPVGGRMRVRATTADGIELDVDIHGRDAWDSQLVVKLWRWLWYRSDGPRHRGDPAPADRAPGLRHLARGATGRAGRAGDRRRRRRSRGRAARLRTRRSAPVRPRITDR